MRLVATVQKRPDNGQGPCRLDSSKGDPGGDSIWHGFFLLLWNEDSVLFTAGSSLSVLLSSNVLLRTYVCGEEPKKKGAADAREPSYLRQTTNGLSPLVLVCWLLVFAKRNWSRDVSFGKESILNICLTVTVARPLVVIMQAFLEKRWSVRSFDD